MDRARARDRIHQVRRAARHHAFAGDPERTRRLTMKLLADWMLDANRQGMMRSFPSRHFDFDELARSLGPLARFDFPRIHVAGATFHVHTQPGGIDVRLQPSTPA